MCRLSWNLGASTAWNPQGLSRNYFTFLLTLQLFLATFFIRQELTRFLTQNDTLILKKMSTNFTGHEGKIKRKNVCEPPYKQYLHFLSLLYRASFQNMEYKPTDVTISILFIYCRISTCFGPTGPSSALYVHTDTRPEQYRHWTNGCVNSCVNSPEDGPVGPIHVEIRQYINKIKIVTSVGFYSISYL